MLTFGGEQVVLPYVEHADESTAPALTLDLLTEAFAHLGDSEVSKPAAEQAPATQAPAQAQAPATQAPAQAPARADVEAGSSRSRRARRNRSASRAQGAANETSIEHREAATQHGAAAGSLHEAKAPAATPDGAAAKPASANEPIILGVGVPASEL